MSQYGDIIAYQYAADLYCPSCIVGLVCEGSDREPVPVPMMETEKALTFLAGQWKIDRDNENSFDSDEFPKVILDDPFDGSEDAADRYHCGYCGSELDS